MRKQTLRRKSLHRRNNQKRAAQRAAKERKRLERLCAPVVVPDVPKCALPAGKPSGFRIVVTCLDDGARVSFTALRGPHGLTVSPSLAGRKVSTVLKEYLPA